MAYDAYNPSPEEQKARFVAYDRLHKMRELKNKKLPHFANQYGQRSFNDYLDDSERVLNGYTMSRESQGKEGWQSNMLDNITRAKMRGIATGVGLHVPDIKCEATHKDGQKDPLRADFSKSIAKKTFTTGNPTLSTFLEVWQLLSHGLVLVYDGYKTGGAKIDRVKSFDSRTGEIEKETVYVEIKGRPFNVLINPQEFYWWDMFIRDVQEQPHLAWVQHYTYGELEREFGKYNNFKYVKDRRSIENLSSLQETLYYTKWSSRVEPNNDYEVLRFYSLEDDIYEVWVNGVALVRAPMLWGHEEKYYPFAKSIAEPFANTNFFAGMSFPGILEAYQDQKNTIINTMTDKLYQSMKAPFLVGLTNKDVLEWETEFVSSENRYYVPDINQVKPMPYNGINQGELAFLQIIDRDIESLSIDRAQQGLESNGDRTLGEAQIADERARELKGMLYLFLEDLWLQKYILRNRTVLTHYLKDKAAAKHMRDNIISIEDFTFANGETGTLDIHVAKSKATLLPQQEIEAREQAMLQTGMIYKLISVTFSVMDDWDINYSIIPGSFHNQNKARQKQEFDDEVQWIVTLYPEFFASNKDTYLKEKLEMRGKAIEDFNPPAPPMMPGQPGAQGQEMPQPSPEPASAPMPI